MPLSKPGLKGELKPEVKSLLEGKFGAPVSGQGAQWFDDFADALSEAIANKVIDHFKTNAQVVVASVSGVTPGGGTSGPGTGTIT